MADHDVLRGVAPSESASISDLRKLLDTASLPAKTTFIKFLEQARMLPGVRLRVRNQGVSAYGNEARGDGKERECFHFGFSGDGLVVYQHGEVSDPRRLFDHQQPKSRRHRYGYITGNDPDENAYVMKIFGRSYAALTGQSLPPPDPPAV